MRMGEYILEIGREISLERRAEEAVKRYREQMQEVERLVREEREVYGQWE